MGLRFQAGDGASRENRELRRYHENLFDLSSLQERSLPLSDEPFVDCWEGWVEESRDAGAFEVLARYLPQLRFPVREGVRTSEAYRAATLRGAPVESLSEATGLDLERPDLITLDLHPTAAGRIPILVSRHRPDFVALVQALAKRNEPVPIPEGQGAVMVAGLPNWERIRRLRRAWESQEPEERETGSWGEEFARIRRTPELFQDRFIVLSDGPYSAVPASSLGLGDEVWRELSLVIRREHECAHYLTRRLFGSMRNHLLDELIADYAGLVAAVGRFRADWFSTFLGLDSEERRRGARIDLYRGDPPLSDEAFEILRRQVRAAAHNLERFDAERWGGTERRGADAAMLAALAALRLDEIGAADGRERLARALERVERSLRAAGPSTTAG